MQLRLGSAAGIAGLSLAVACATPPGYRVEAELPPLRISLREFVEERLAQLGYDVTTVMPRSTSTTFSAVKIRPDAGGGSLIYDWLHVTVTTARLVTEPESVESARGNYVEVRAESFAHDRERLPIPPTPGVIADAEAFVAALRIVPAQISP